YPFIGKSQPGTVQRNRSGWVRTTASAQSAAAALRGPGESVAEPETAQVDLLHISNADEHDHDVAAGPATDDRPGRFRVHAELRDLCRRSAIGARSVRDRHLRAEVLQQPAGDRVPV